MKPYSSSSEKENCSPVSSNCVEWQGPFIQCINHCKGDSVSDVVYKLSQKVCDIVDVTAVDNINLTCILNACDNLSAPDGTLGSLLQTIVDGVCCSVTSLSQQTASLTARTSNLYNEPSLVLPTNFQYTDPNTGLPVARLPLNEFASNTATNASTLRTTVDIHTVQISNQEMRVQGLESNPGYIPPTVTPLGSYGGIVSGVPTQMNLLLTAVENDYTLYKMSVGDTTDIINATNSQTPFLGSSEALGQTGVMSSIDGWNNSVGNLAQSIQNLWLTVSDVRTAVNSIKQTIAPDCSKFLLSFVTLLDTPRTELDISYNGLTVIPAGFTNCPTLSTITVTDGVVTWTTSFDLLASVDDGGSTFDLTSSGLNPALPYTITINGCIINSGLTCSKTVTVINVPTTTTTTSVAPVGYSVQITQDDINKATGNTTVPYYDDKVFLAYFNQSGVYTILAYSSPDVTVICVSPGTTPAIYYFASNTQLPPGTSTATNIINCL